LTRNCCMSFSTVSSLVGSSFPCSKAMRIINVPTWDAEKTVEKLGDPERF
jgi:hypothetical protein